MRNQHQHLHEMARRDVTTIDGQVVSVVYVTATPTFTGVIGGYVTSSSSPDVSQSTTQEIPPEFATATTTTSSRSRLSQSKDPFSYDLSSLSAQYSSTAVVTSSAATSLLAFSSATAAASSNYNSYNTVTGSSPISPVSTGSSSVNSGSSNASETSSSSDPTSAGLSTAGKAGLAIGIILAIGIVLALLLFLLGKKKKQVKAEQARQDSEKNAATVAAAAANAQPVNAPRLSLRPASSFLPEFMGGTRPKSRLSQAGMLGGSSNEPNPTKEKYLAASASQNIPMTEKTAPGENPFKDPENPFADNAHPASQHLPEPLRMPEPAPKRAPCPVHSPQISPVLTGAPAPILAPVPKPAPAPMAMPEPIAHASDETAVAVATAAASAGAIVAAQSALPKEEGPAQFPQADPIEMPSPPTTLPAPLSTPKSVKSSAPPPTAGTPDGQVYRILMDFAPSMEDELELKGGQVVRMLHEYDDGWCLCTRLDRSQQGVVPRTCLAVKPSKPRPGPGPGLNQQRPMSPAMHSPQGRPMSPAMRNGPPRPMSPGQGRSMSPGPQGRPRAGSQGRMMSPARMAPQNGTRSMSPGAYNQPPRPLSPGPRSSQQTRRAQSPGPYGHAGGPKPMAPNQRRRSNSSSAAAREVRDRRASPPGPSPLGGFAPGMAI